MKLVWQLIGAVCIVAGVCLFYAPQVKSQIDAKAAAQEAVGSVQQHPMPCVEKAGQWELTTTDNKVFSGRMREGNFGTFISNDDGEVLIPREKIKGVKQVAGNGSTNRSGNGGDIQRNAENR